MAMVTATVTVTVMVMVMVMTTAVPCLHHVAGDVWWWTTQFRV